MRPHAMQASNASKKRCIIAIVSSLYTRLLLIIYFTLELVSPTDGTESLVDY